MCLPWCRLPVPGYCPPHQREKTEQERRWKQLQTSRLLLMMEGKDRVEGATSRAEISAVLNWMAEEEQ